MLSPATTYTVTLKSGSSGVKDVLATLWRRTSSWSFSTAPVPNNSGPGGPILVISSAANPFSRYYGEILSAEGLNEYLVADISNGYLHHVGGLRRGDSGRHVVDQRAGQHADDVGERRRPADRHASG